MIRKPWLFTILRHDSIWASSFARFSVANEEVAPTNSIAEKGDEISLVSV